MAVGHSSLMQSVFFFKNSKCTASDNERCFQPKIERDFKIALLLNAANVAPDNERKKKLSTH